MRHLGAFLVVAVLTAFRFITERHLPASLQHEAVEMSKAMLKQRGQAEYHKRTGLSRLPTTDDQVRQFYKSVLMIKGDSMWPEKTFPNPMENRQTLMKIIEMYR